ncbi:MAG: putative tRNA/rRNA methyltransferase [Candidatus Heimdallarchaeota archaeon LC_2]|nr:MAG: putative tRNA/rRNA methyltransferase [Candidatus Heimdallarchaeota archaeon LC_2]
MKLSIIVVGIKHSGNLGALARLCSNYGVSKLIAVAPECDIDDEAYQRATWGRPYLDNLIIVNNLDETKSHVETLIGLSARIGGYNNLSRSSISVKDIPTNVSTYSGTIGIVLGREDYGLSNEELDTCDFLCHIPMPGENQVLNISHAASIALWELSREQIKGKSVNKEDQPLHEIISQEKRRVIFEYLDEILPHSWIKEENFDGIRKVFRNVLGRSFVTEREGNAIVGTFRGISKTVLEGHPHWDKCNKAGTNES